MERGMEVRILEMDINWEGGRIDGGLGVECNNLIRWKNNKKIGAKTWPNRTIGSSWGSSKCSPAQIASISINFVFSSTWIRKSTQASTRLLLQSSSPASPSSIETVDEILMAAWTRYCTPLNIAPVSSRDAKNSNANSVTTNGNTTTTPSFLKPSHASISTTARMISATGFITATSSSTRRPRLPSSVSQSFSDLTSWPSKPSPARKNVILPLT